MTSCKPRDGGSHLLQVNATGVMPVIFSSSLLALPTALERYLGNIPGLQQGARALAPNGPLYLPVSIGLPSEHVTQNPEAAGGGWKRWAVCRALFTRGWTLLQWVITQESSEEVPSGCARGTSVMCMCLNGTHLPFERSVRRVKLATECLFVTKAVRCVFKHSRFWKAPTASASNLLTSSTSCTKLH